MKHIFNNQELATVLAALRYWQGGTFIEDRKIEMPEHFEEVNPLNDEEIDYLCMKINKAR